MNDLFQKYPQSKMAAKVEVFFEIDKVFFDFFYLTFNEAKYHKSVKIPAHDLV